MKPHSGATAGSITLACGHLSSILHTVAAEASCGESSADKAEFDAFTALFNDCPRKYRVLAIEKHVCNIICSINARIVDRVLLDVRVPSGTAHSFLTSLTRCRSLHGHCAHQITPASHV